ncbi:MAG: carboxypeptidase regulatory-like domain-containing protein, partial [Lacunisphaera sp.]|nr:carboxypeptidase regulatory-like domain-containing protein [Lacunisphaera sp.]
MQTIPPRIHSLFVSLLRVAGKALAFVTGVALALGAIALQAQTTGTLTGRVTDASAHLALAGTRVTVQGTELETYTGPAGDYVLAGVPAGSQTVEFGYIGYPEQTRAVRVEAGRSVRADAAFATEALQLDKFVINGSLVGTARALNQQRGAATLKNIVASDEIGNFPDQNAAESLQRIPGVSLYRDQGEGRYIVLRGLNYTVTSVKVNG